MYRGLELVPVEGSSASMFLWFELLALRWLLAL